MKNVFLIIIFSLSAILINAQSKHSEYVNPIIGTNGMGHTFPGACVPFGAVQLSPDTDTVPFFVDGAYNKGTYAYCAGYQYKDPTIVGFSHTHFSGTGHSDLGDILIMPTVGELRLNSGTADSPESGYRSRFSHDTESASPGYYKVKLDGYGVDVELTATKRVGVHKYSYPKDSDGRIILDLSHGIYNYDGKVLWASLRVENDTLLTGYRITNGWARTNYTYFAISLSQPIKDYGYVDNRKPSYNGFWRRFKENKNFPEMGGKNLVSYFNFDTKSNPELVVKVALSAVSTEGAVKNLKAEAEDKSFNQILAEAKASWAKELSVIDAKGSEDQMTMLYTSLYHTMINPSIYQDVDGMYRGLDNNIHKAEGFTNYTIFSLWDTYRAQHPLLALLKPEENTNMVKSMIKHQEQSVHGMLPVWSHMANDNWCMSGYHATSVLSDAIIKGADVDMNRALQSMVATSNVPYYEGIDNYVWLGHVPFDQSHTAASTTLEYAYDDWSIYATALKIGNKRLIEQYRQRALNYRNLFDPRIDYARPRFSNGTFKPDFDILQTHGEGFIEGNTCNFSFHVPHDVLGLKTIMGGDKVFVKRLDNLFEMDLPKKYYELNEDITASCLVGGYVHGNEPSHHVPYLYAWSSQPYKSQYWLREIMNKMYRNNIDGLGGNDDCGQMSSWYIFTAMGFYPVCPGTDQYVLGAPFLPYMKLNLPNGKTFEIIAPKVSDKNRYVRSVQLNGKEMTKLYITHDEIISGGKLEFVMSSSPHKSRGKTLRDKPYSMTNGEIENPLAKWSKYNVGEIVFTDKASGTKGSEIYNKIVTNPKSYIEEQAKIVLNTLYFSPDDKITPVQKLSYSLEDIDGVSAKGGSNGEISIWYSTKHIEKSFGQSDTAKLDYETRGVLLHELTHAYQLEPQGIGIYGTNKVFWAFIEGMADACRVMNGCFTASDRPRGGNYRMGYCHGGFFFAWIAKTIDPDFIRKFNRSANEINPWSFDAAIKHTLGSEYNIDELWNEYQFAMGDI